MRENAFQLPEKFIFSVCGQSYNCELIDARCHIWRVGQDYETATRRGNVGIWSSYEISKNFRDGYWPADSIQVDYADEEDISVGSLEGVL